MTRFGRFYTRALGWGIATGAVTGAVIGTLILTIPWNGSSWYPSLAPVGTLYGAVGGALGALVPTVVGALVVATVLRFRHPHHSNVHAVARNLKWMFATVVALINVGPALVALGDGEWLAAVLLLVAADAALVLMLCRANRDLSAVWAS